MPEHIVTAFDKELKALSQKILEMGGIAESMMGDALDALATQNETLAKAVIAADLQLDQLQRDIEESAILTIARRQPMAVDLRQVVAALRIASDLERVGDMVKNLAKRALVLGGERPPGHSMNGLKTMSLKVLGQLNMVLDAYTSRDVEAALQVWKNDGEVDALYNSLFRELLTYMMEDPRNITFCTHLLFSAKNLERVGDHTTNIAETIYFMVTGDTLTNPRPKGDTVTMPKL